MKDGFLKEDMIALLSKLQSNDKGKWGKMNAQQMVEHLSEYVRIASGKVKAQIVNTGEVVKKYYDFMMSDKPFRENTPNAIMPDEPPPVKQPDMKSAIGELKNEVAHFFKTFQENPSLKTSSPFFGELTFEENLHLLHKHFTHHAKQFGLI
jgi:hypothetical protein